MRRVVGPSKQALLDMETSFHFEYDFTMEKAEHIAETRMREKMLAVFPFGSDRDDDVAAALELL